MNKTTTESHLEAFRTLAFACMACFVVQIIFVFVDGFSISLLVASLNAAHAFLALAVGVWLYKKRNNIPKIQTLELAFIIISVPFLFTIWIGESAGLALGQIRQPFVPFQLLCIYIALLSPGRTAVSALGIFVTLGVVVASWFVFKSQYPMTGLNGEPWVTLTMGFISLMLLSGRAYRKKIIQKLEKTKAEAEAFERASRLFLAIRDRANSPLQVINLCATLIMARNPEEVETVERLQRSLTKLQELTEILAETEIWRETYKAGGDISAEIDKTFNKLI